MERDERSLSLQSALSDDIQQASAHYSCYRETWDPQELDQAIHLFRSTIMLVTMFPLNDTYGRVAEPKQPRQASIRTISSGRVDGVDLLRQWRLHLVTALGDLFEHHQDDLSSLNEQVLECRDALDGLAISHPLFSALQHWLGFALCRLYEASTRTSDLEQAIVAQRCASLNFVDGFITRSDIYFELSYSLVRSSQQSGSSSDLDESVAIARQAINVLSDNCPHRFLFLARLAYACVFSYMANGTLEMLYEAVRIAEAALKICPPKHRDRHKALGVAAMVNAIYYEHSNDVDAIERAVQYLTIALPMSLDAYGNNLAISLQRRFARKGDVADLERSIKVSRETLQHVSLTYRFRHYTLSNLSVALRHLYVLRGDPATLEEAIKLQRQGVEECTRGDPQRSIPVDNLARLLLLRFRQSVDIEDLQEAVGLWREALALQPTGRMGHGAALCQLAKGLVILFEETNEVQCLDEAIQLLEQLRKDGNPTDHRRSEFLFAAGKAYYTRFQYFSNHADIDNSLEQHHSALSLRPIGHPERHRSLHELASMLRARYELASGSCPSDSDISEARSFQQQALDLIPVEHPDHPLLHCGLARLLYASGSPIYSISGEMDAVTKALMNKHSSAQTRVSEAADVLEGLDHCIAGLAVRPPILCKQLLGVHKLAIGLLPSIAHFGLDIRARLRLLRRAEQIVARAARIALSLNESIIAVEILEEGRAVFWTQYLRLRTQFDGLPGGLSEELSMIANQLEAGSDGLASTPSVAQGGPHSKAMLEEQATKRRLLSERFDVLVKQARSLLGDERYLLPASYEVLSQVARNGVVVTLVPGETESYALVMRHATDRAAVTSLTLPITVKRLLELSDELQDANFFQRQRLRNSADRNTTLLPGARNLLRELWSSIVQPIFAGLQLQV